ncbi:YjfB family protein [Clostridium sp.]|uniref:YjfB family protein n=1 Tax=Clostridium sp. TaxID=1506 RepID=UPI0039F4FD4D
MDIAMMSIVNNQNKVKDAASLLLMKKIMNISQTNAANMTEMIKAVDPNLGSNFDKMA